MARAPGFDLAKALASPSFTPGARDASALVELVVGGEEPTSVRAAAALAKLGEQGRKAIDARLAGTANLPDVDVDAGELSDAATARLVGALGLLARTGDDAARHEARTELLTFLGNSHVRVRRAAIAALGKLVDPDLDAVRAALNARWDATDVTPDERRTLAEALGKLGGADSVSRLRELAPGNDAELARRRDRALLIAERTAKRVEPSTIAVDVAPPAPVPVALRCKPGLGPLLADELRQQGFKPDLRDDATVGIRLAEPWQSLERSRLWANAAIEIELRGEDLERAIVDAIVAPHVRGLLSSWTRGPIRWRVGFSGGHRRAVVWRIAKEVAARAPELVNDPTQTTWDFMVGADEQTLGLMPRRAHDPRFAWRVAEVPAASHPSVAAALAFVAGARPEDRVWDPFVGSGAELIERARLGPVAQLVGTDIDERALSAASSNIDAAGLSAVLAVGDARTYEPGGVDLIITNPPLGSRVQLDAAQLLVDALPHFADVLELQGRLVWITPATKKTTPAAERLGFTRTRSYPVDLGGVRGTLERWERRS
jgi:23S rRNA G2445 N2-methylase RlmL